MDTPRISAIVPTYGAARFMAGCLDDLLAQTIAEQLEIIVVDTASPEDEGEIVRAYQQRHSNIQYIRTDVRENSTAALNRGIAAARGRFLTNANTDDRHRPDALELQCRVLEQHAEFGLVYADSLINEVENETFAGTSSRLRFDWPDYNLNTALNVCMFGPHPVWRREVHRHLGMFDPEHPIASDQDMFLRIAWHFGAVHLRETLGLFLRRPDSVSGSARRRETIEDVMKVLTKYRTQIPLRDLFPGLRDQVGRRDAEVAAWIEFGNLCALGPYTDLQMALQAYRKAQVLLEAAPQLRAAVDGILHNNMGCVLASLGREDLALQSLALAGDAVATRANQQLVRASHEQTLRPLQFQFLEFLHPVVLAARRNQGLLLDGDGGFVWSEERYLAPWDVYVGPDGVPVGEAEFADSQASKPRCTVDLPPVEAADGSRHIALVMYGWADSGGGTILPRQVAKEYARRGFRVSVFYAGVEPRPELGPYGRRSWEEDGVELLGIFNRPYTFMNLSDPLAEIDDPHIRVAFEEWLAETQPGVVHFFNLHNLGMSLVETCRQAGVPALFSSNNYWAFCPRLYLFDDNLDPCPGPAEADCASCLGNRSAPYNYAARLDAARLILGEGFDLHLAVSERVRELYLQNGADPARTRVLYQQPRSVDVLWEQLGAARQPEGRLERPLRVGYIGSVLPHKGVHLLVAALQAFAEGAVEGIVHGDVQPDYLAHLQGLDRKDRVDFRGAYSIDDMPRMLADLDVVVVPSIWEDCAPYVVAEAQAGRCPVVGADIGGIPEFYAEGQTGLSFQPGDLKSLATALGRLVFEPELLGQMQAAITAPRGFAAYIDELLAAYDEVCNTRRAGVKPAALSCR